MYYPNTSSSARAYQESLLAEVTRDKYTMKVIRRTKPRLQGRMFLRLSDLMVSLGLKLRERYEPAMACGPEVRSSATGKASA